MQVENVIESVIESGEVLFVAGVRSIGEPDAVEIAVDVGLVAIATSCSNGDCAFDGEAVLVRIGIAEFIGTKDTARLHT